MPYGNGPVSSQPIAGLLVLAPLLRQGMLRRVLPSSSTLVGQLRPATGR